MKARTTNKSGVTAFERSYRKALRMHAETAASEGSGERIGRRALRLGIGTLALARIHERASSSLTRSRTSAGFRSLSDSFFAASVAPLEGAHSGATRALAESIRSGAQLDRRATDLASLRARLASEVGRRKLVQKELRASEREKTRIVDHSRSMEVRMRRLSHRLLSAQEEERLRISRDLHDAIGQTLTGINVGLATLEHQAAAKSRELGSAIAEAQRLVERSMKTVHRFAWELRPTLLDDLGLVPALRSYAKTFSERTGVRVRFAAEEGLARLGGELSTALFRVAQGALTNVERHAQATHVRLSLRALPAALRLEIRDDGRGFDVRRMQDARTQTHLGLLVMRERVEMVRGTFSVESSRGRGTTVRVEVPLVESDGGA